MGSSTAAPRKRPLLVRSPLSAAALSRPLRHPRGGHPPWLWWPHSAARPFRPAPPAPPPQCHSPPLTAASWQCEGTLTAAHNTDARQWPVIKTRRAFLPTRHRRTGACLQATDAYSEFGSDTRARDPCGRVHWGPHENAGPPTPRACVRATPLVLLACHSTLAVRGDVGPRGRLFLRCPTSRSATAPRLCRSSLMHLAGLPWIAPLRVT